MSKFEASFIVAGIGGLYGAVIGLITVVPFLSAVPVWVLLGPVRGFVSGSLAICSMLAFQALRRRNPNFAFASIIALSLLAQRLLLLQYYSLVSLFLSVYLGYRIDKDIVSDQPKLSGVRYVKQLLIESGQLILRPTN